VNSGECVSCPDLHCLDSEKHNCIKMLSL
jgi:hypothetical protein